MDSNSLDWLREDFNSHNLAEEIEDDYLGTINDSNSDTSSKSSYDIDCSLLIGNEKSEEQSDENFDDIKLVQNLTI